MPAPASMNITAPGWIQPALTVIGAGHVFTTDGIDHHGKPDYPLSPGDRFDLDMVVIVAQDSEMSDKTDPAIERMSSEEVEKLLKSSPVLRWMDEKGVPLNRDNYIALNWWGEAPTGDDWTASPQ